jgi:hypothetical protein
MKNESNLIRACDNLQLQLNELTYTAASVMSSLPTAHDAGGVVLNILNKNAALKQFYEMLYQYKKENITDYQI